MTHNTMKRRLSRCYKLTPREARLLLRSSNYDYNLAESVLIQRGPESCRLSIDDICTAIQGIVKVTTKIVKAMAEACSAFGKTFSEVMNLDE